MIVGIDLGTTNCAIGVWREGQAELIPNSLGHRLTPSAVSFDEETGAVLTGLAARERQSTHPHLTATAFKRYMGSTRRTKLGKRDLLPEELSALVLQRLKADAEAYLGQPVTEAVITVPAYFNDKQRKATRRAGELAGLKVERLLNEPTAAALAYGIQDVGAESRFLVFDLGGGTFDVSVLEMFEGVVEVRASTGDNRLGGEDFNEIVVDGFCRTVGAEIPAGDRQDPVLSERLREAAERTRRALTDQSEVTMSVTWRDRLISAKVTAELFEEWAEPLLARLREPVLRALRDSQIRADELAEIVLVGGSTRMPLVRKTATRMFGRFPSHAVHPDEAVAIGATIQAGLKARDSALKEVILTDVCPYSLGVETVDRSPMGALREPTFSPIIERNTIIPASRVSQFSTVFDNQRHVELRILQGESRRAADNVLLGSLSIPVPRDKAGHIALDVRFTYDVNGLLEVDVHIPRTGERRDLVIVDDSTLTSEQIAHQRQALSALKQHPRDNDANRHAMARAERCFENALGDERIYLSRLIAQFEGQLETQDPRAIEHARVELHRQLDALEGETWL